MESVSKEAMVSLEPEAFAGNLVEVAVGSQDLMTSATVVVVLDIGLTSAIGD